MNNTTKLVLGATALAALASGCVPRDLPTGSLAACRSAADAEAGLKQCTSVIEKKDVPAPDRAIAYVVRSGWLQSTGKGAEAIADADAAIRLAPKDATILANRGAIYGMQGKLDAGARDLDAAIAMGPESSFMLGNRATIHDQAGEWAEGHVLIKRAQKLDPNSFNVLSELCWNGAAGSPDPAGAVADCDVAIGRFNDANNFNSRGMAYYRSGKYREAIADYDRSIELDPKVGSSYYMRGLAKQNIGDDGARADLDKGLALEPGVRERYVRVGILPSE